MARDGFMGEMVASSWTEVLWRDRWLCCMSSAGGRAIEALGTVHLSLA
jgi:hypothetical protein